MPIDRDPTTNNFPNDYTTNGIDNRILLRSKAIREKMYGVDVREALAQGVEIGGSVAQNAKDTSDQVQKDVQSAITTLDTKMQTADVTISSMNDLDTKLEALRQQLQTIVDGADASLKSQLADFQTQFNSKLDDLQTLYTTAESKRDSDWQADKTSINTDWQTLKTSLNSQISSLQTLLNNVQTQVNTLNNTTLPALDTNVSAVSDKVTALQQDLNGVDWPSYVKSINGIKPDSNGNVTVDSGGVKTVNGANPDANGNVSLAIPDEISLKSYTDTATNTVLTNAKDYADTTANTTLSDAKSYTDTKMSNVYTKPQVDEAIANAKPSGNYQKSWSGTLSQYQALGTYDTTTVYYILSGYEVVTN